MGKNDIVNKVDENKTNPAMKVLMYAFLIFWALVNIFPIYFMFTFSLKSNEEIFGKMLSVFLRTGSGATIPQPLIQEAWDFIL